MNEQPDASSVMKQPDARHGHTHGVVVAGSDNLLVAVATAWLNHPLHAVLRSHIDAVAEREEGV